MAASSTAQPPGVVKTLTDDKKRKRPVKKRRGKKLTVAESEAESEAHAEAEAEAEAARSSKRSEASHLKVAANRSSTWTQLPEDLTAYIFPASLMSMSGASSLVN
eukprot:jgi/Tetstr1/420336/TSEL_011457.t1